jgi:hypothetical protein
MSTHPGLHPRDRSIRNCCYGNEYLVAENLILKTPVEAAPEVIGRRASEARRDWPSSGRKALGEVATAALPDTILAWYRRLVSRKFDGQYAAFELRQSQEDPFGDRRE